MRESAAETRVALLTAPSPGAIAVVALRGAACERLLRGLARHRRGDGPVEYIDGRPTLCRLVVDHEPVDDAIVCVFDGGRQAEICLHGSVRIAERIVAALTRGGARHVGADEFIADDEVDPTIREIDAALARCDTRRLSRWLLHQRAILPEFLRRHSPPGTRDDAERTAILQRSRSAMRVLRGISIAVVGPPNAGKSTLANRLIGRERIITSDVPGTTRDWVQERASIAGWPVTLTDTAGLRATHDPIEDEAIRLGLQQTRGADLVLIVLDASAAPEELRARHDAVFAALQTDAPRVRVMNKCDVPGAERAAALWTDACRISALDGTGIDALEAAIAAVLGLDLLREDAPTPLTPRQCRAIGLTLE